MEYWGLGRGCSDSGRVIDAKLLTLWRSHFYAPRSVIGGILFLPCLFVCLFVCPSVCLSATLTLAITFVLLEIETSYLACMYNSWSCTFWWVQCQGQGHGSRSKVKLIGQINIVHNSCTIRDRDFILGMHVQLIELHLLMGQMSRSRSRVKVKGQINRSNCCLGA